MKLPITLTPDGKTRVFVRVTPKSSRNGMEGVYEDAAGKVWLKVRLTVAPEDGKANKALLKLLSKEWSIAASSMQIVTGQTSREKCIEIDDAGVIPLLMAKIT